MPLKLQSKPSASNVDAKTLTLEDALITTLVFAYPKGSRSLATFQFWLAMLCGGALLAPLAFGRVTEPGDGWILFLLGSGLVWAGAGHRRRLRWLGTELSLSAETLTQISSNGCSHLIPWSRIVSVRTRRWSRRLEFETMDASSITVWPELIAYEQFTLLAREHLRTIVQCVI